MRKKYKSKREWSLAHPARRRRRRRADDRSGGY